MTRDDPGDGGAVVPFPGFRQPAANVDAERALIGALMIHGAKLWDKAGALVRPEHFAVAEHAVIWRACGQLIAAGRVADPITLRDHWQGSDILADVGGPAYLMKLANAAVTVINAAEYARIVRQCALKRELAALLDEYQGKLDHRSDVLQTPGLVASELAGRLEALQAAGDGDDGLPLFDPSALDGVEPKPRAWLVEDWIPKKAVTALYGLGGRGKSLLAQMLATSTATGRPWLGMPAARGRVLVFGCEDDVDEMHRRQQRINAGYGIGRMGALENVAWSDRVGQNNFLWIPSPTGGELTPLFYQLMRAASAFAADLVIVDTAAHTFGGLELDRGQVTQFVSGCLGKLAQATGAAVLLCAHPPKDGKQYSGSTAWDASVRSRLYLDVPQGAEPDDPRRWLGRAKVNYAPAGAAGLELGWADGILVVERVAKAPLLVGADRDELNALVAACVGDLVARGLRPRLAANTNQHAPKLLQRSCHELAPYSLQQIENAILEGTRSGAIRICEARDNGRVSQYYDANPNGGDIE